MSSTYVRTEFNNFMAAYTPTQKIIQLAGVFEYLTDHLKDQGVGAEDTWVGLEYFGDDEVPIPIIQINVCPERSCPKPEVDIPPENVEAPEGLPAVVDPEARIGVS